MKIEPMFLSYFLVQSWTTPSPTCARALPIIASFDETQIVRVNGITKLLNLNLETNFIKHFRQGKYILSSIYFGSVYL